MKPFLVCVSLLFLPSCSVIMATNKSGLEIEALQKTHSRDQLVALGAKPILTEENEEGLLTETYSIQRERGSLARALMHGLLDISTLFAWELVGTPIESAFDEKKFYTVKVTFDENEHIQKMELFN